MKLVQNHGHDSYLYSDKGLSTLVDENGKSLFDTNDVKKNLFLTRNKLTSLKGCPRKVRGDFGVAMNPLTSLEGAPVFVGDDCVLSSTLLSGLEHAPRHIGWSLFLQDMDNLKSLKGIHKVIDHIGGTLNLSGTKLTSHILGIFKIRGLKNVGLDDQDLMKLCNKLLNDLNRDDPERKTADALLNAQEALIDAGYDDFALL